MRGAAAGGAADLRLTWVQPEDLIGHELAQAARDGRDATEIEQRWREAGGHPAPPRAGASPAAAPARLRALADELLGELALLESPLAVYEPTDLAAIKAMCPAWPSGTGDHRTPRRPDVPSRTACGPQDLKVFATPPPDDGSQLLDVTRTSTTSGPAPERPGVPGGRPRPAPLTVAQLHAAWLGRAAGCLLGKPVEKLPLAGIRALAAATGNWPLRTWFTAKGLPADLAAAYPWNRRSAPTSLAENIDGMPEDDDLNYPLLNLLLLQRHGREFTTAQVAKLWLDELPAGRTFTAERVAYGNLLRGIEPPHTARHHNPFREWIGASIRADVHGWTHPGDPAAAAEQAYRDAVLTHTANGVYGAMFVAATLATAAGQGADGDVHACLRAGLSVVPPRSRLADAVRLGIAVAGEHDRTGFDPVVDLLHSALGHYHWVHVVPNTALLAAALTHADGDFTGSICRAVSGGWDTDSNGATAGSVAGLLAGHPGRLPERWTAPLKNRLATSVGGLDGVGFDALAELTHPLAAPTPAPEEALHP
ncbi:ADP-ribosylglycohydrolase family protein [Streptomyces liangshanensis]|uniref:ADP-ribosylglycohydrolase family protein n=1 Tax=Streptomyces liangshanensis TaxID=2717324 RepID=A0A6G9H569_9ACTN|nr:ADP-ribosylglycohydrolase family protein [Streptomyces liangshanensis]QIQ05257.1 ADP-ribosylglycohydrolase family protein [Streptomyces liangshanensis]